MRAFRGTGLQLGHHKVIQVAPLGVARAGDRENVVAEPADQQRHILGQCHRVRAGDPGATQALCWAVCGLGAAALGRSPQPVTPPLALFSGFYSAIGTVLQEADHLLQIGEDVEHIALAGDMGKSLGYTGAKTRAGIGDGPLGLEALSHQIEQVDAPGVGIAMLLQTQQKAIGRVGVDTHEHRLLGLENLVEGSIVDAR